MDPKVAALEARLDQLESDHAALKTQVAAMIAQMATAGEKSKAMIDAAKNAVKSGNLMGILEALHSL